MPRFLHASILTLLLLVIGACSSPTEGEDETGDNCTVRPSPFDDALTQQGAVRDVHDPVVIEHAGSYYLFSTGYGIPIRRSADLIDWQIAGQVFSELPEWVDGAVAGVEFPWAPDISYFNGQYHLYYSVSTFGSQRSAIGLATNATLDPTDPDYEWVDRGAVITSRPGLDDFNAIDANVAFDDAGRPWLSWGSYWGGIRMHAIDPETGLLSDTDDTIYSLAFRPIVSSVEAPFIIKRDDFYYLFVSWDQCCVGIQSSYKVMVGRSEEITGPYLDKSGEDLMVGGGTLVLQGYGRIRGPGHNAVLTEGDRRYLVHHFYDAGDGGVPKLQIRPLLFDAQGWPLAGAPYEDDGDFPAPSPSVVGTWGHSVGFAPPFEIQVLEGGRVERCRAEGTWSLQGSELTLEWTLAGGDQQSEHVIVSGNGMSYVGRDAEGRIIHGSRAGTAAAKSAAMSPGTVSEGLSFSDRQSFNDARRHRSRSEDAPSNHLKGL